jgi:hypothetical protein
MLPNVIHTKVDKIANTVIATNISNKEKPTRRHRLAEPPPISNMTKRVPT